MYEVKLQSYLRVYCLLQILHITNRSISMNQKPTSFRILYSVQYISELTDKLFWISEIHKTDVRSYDNSN